MSNLISVIIPIYNAETFLRICIDSVLKQTYNNIEILLIDDGSTDNSGKICDEIKLLDNRVKVFHKENGGLTSAWIYGLKNTSNMSDFVVFLDSDDWLENRCIESMVREQKKTYADIVVTKMKQVYVDHEEYIDFDIEDKFYDRYAIEKEIYPILLDTGYFEKRAISVSRCSKLIKKQLLINNIKYCNDRTTFAEDLNIMFPVFLDMNSISIISDENSAYCYRMNNSSMLHGYDPNKQKSVKYVYNSLLSICRDKQKKEFISQIKVEYLSGMVRCFTNELQNPKGIKSIQKNIKELSKDLLLKEIIKKVKWNKYPKKIKFIIYLLKNFNFIHRVITIRILIMLKLIQAKKNLQKWNE